MKSSKFLIILSGIIFNSFFSHAEPLKISELTKSLREEGAHWYVKKMENSELSKVNSKYRLGLSLENAPEVQLIDQSSTNLVINIPTQLDWRNKDGKNWITPIKDQANCGSCVAFASIGVLEAQYKISSLFPDLNIHLSPQHLFSCGGGFCDSGWRPERASKYLLKFGVPDEACMPYLSGASGKDIACRNSCSDSHSRVIKLANYYSPTWGYQNIDAVKLALQNGPLVTSMKVFADFAFYAGGIYKHVKGDALGGHAVSIVGYDDLKRAFIIRNSWGDDWGENGYAYVSYDDISGIGEYTWSYAVQPFGGGISIHAPDNNSYYTEKLKVVSKSSFNQTAWTQISIYDSKKNVVLSQRCQNIDCDEEIDITHIPDGRYEIELVAKNSSDKEIGISHKHYFYIVNNEPTLNLQFEGHNRVDLKKPLKERVEFLIKARSSSVPMSRIEFHRIGPDGKETIREASIVPEELTMGWSTELIENGDYEIWFIGYLNSNILDIKTESSHLKVKIKN